ncbi:MAG: TetR/AcrR family transcriptional regulator [Deltaproteobacteria bacterium]|nr:TetR/AcrR family transcriptional regulator [Deltaproteobacteria bacterium]
MNIVDKTKERYLEYERRHQEILDAAIRVFNSKGYNAATTAEIAREAGISEPIMYKHFGSKPELFLACFRSISDELLEAYREVYKNTVDNEVGYLEGVARVYIDFVENNPHKSMFLVHLLSYRDKPEFERVFMDFMDASIEGVRRIIEAAKEKGRIRSTIDARILAGFFVNQYFTVVALKELGGFQQSFNDVFFEIIHSMLKIE